MITGSYPPDVCGVGDYSACFMRETDCEKWNLYHSSNWKVNCIITKIREINSYGCKYIVMQYPTQGYGWSLLPQLICLYYSWFTRKRFTVVLHEFSQRTFKAKIASLFLLFANKVIFTSEYEKLAANRIVCGLAKNAAVIRILSNITAELPLHPMHERDIDVAYFGHLRPQKGLEDFIQIINTIHTSRSKIRVCIIGQRLVEYETYLHTLLNNCKHNVELHFNCSNLEAAQLLNKTKIVFLPFIDGLSERRGSFLAAISNGTLVVSYTGRFTTKELKNIFISTSYPHAVETILSILDTMDDDTFEFYQKKSQLYLHNNLPSCWKSIVSMYEEFITV